MISLIAAGVVCLVFASSGILKLRQTQATLRAMSALRVPASLRKPALARALPVFEIIMAVGIMLCSGLALLGVLLLLALVLLYFTTLLLGALRRSEKVSCNCFGASLGSGEVTPRGVVRNLAILGLVALVLLDTKSKIQVLATLYRHDELVLYRVILVWLLLLLAFLAYRLSAVKHVVAVEQNQNATAGTATTGIVSAGIGDPIPETEVVNDQGIAITLPRLGRGMPTLLVFLSAECGSCAQTARHIDKWSGQLAPLVVRVITSSRPEQIQGMLGSSVPLVRYGAKSSVAALGVDSLPAAVMLGSREQPVVASEIAHGHAAIQELVDSVLQSMKASSTSGR